LSSRSSILITGFTGQVGSQLADYVLENTDLDIFGFMRWQEPLDNISHLLGRINNKDRVSLIYGDVLDYPSLVRAVETSNPRYVSHLAAQSFPKTSFDSPIETLQTNAIGTANLLEVLRTWTEKTSQNPAIHICSSSEVYGKAEPGKDIQEDTPFHGASPYSISKIATDFLGRFYGEAYNLRTFVTRMGTHSGPRRSDVFFESTVAKQVAMIEAGLQEPVIYVGNLQSVRTFQDARDAVRAYFLLLEASERGEILPGSAFNIAGDEAFTLNEIVSILLEFSHVKNIDVQVDASRLRPIDADYQMFDNRKIKESIDWNPEIPVKVMLGDLLQHWRTKVRSGFVPLNR